MKSEELKLQNMPESHLNRNLNLPFISFLQQKAKYSTQSQKKRFLPYKSGKKKIKIRIIKNEYQNTLAIENGLYIKPQLLKTMRSYQYQKAKYHKDKQICCLLKQQQNIYRKTHNKRSSRTHRQPLKLQAYSRYDVINAEKRYKPIQTNTIVKILQPQLHSSFQQKLNTNQRVKKMLKTISFQSRDYFKKPQGDLYNSYIHSHTNRRKVLS